ncbi:MAG TPA: class I SAM-dependent methyltransferase, partial [Ktedonobacterales bacterium]|nr:class I SAM-dependent methyltransferase [Ktedonobacterales bacterium]
MNTVKTKTEPTRATFVPTQFDPEKAQQFVGKVVVDCAAAVSVALAVIGDQLGLYRALAGAGPFTSIELAERTNTSERYIREWLINQAAAGYLDYDAQTGRYTLPDERAVALVDEDSPYHVGGALMIALAMTKAEPRIRENFRTGAGMRWGEHDRYMFEGCERLFRPGYLANLVQSWIPALDGVQQKLERGAKVADIGCGHGASTIILAKAYPNSHFYGFDAHAASVGQASALAREAGVADRVTFEVASGTDYPGVDYDLVAYFDCLHDMGDPANSIRHTRDALAPDGTVLLVEPAAGAHVEDNFNPVGQFYAGASALVCTPNALATGSEALGTVATDEAVGAVVRKGGLSQFRRVLDTPLNRI